MAVREVTAGFRKKVIQSHRVSTITLLGMGAWGTALALVLAKNEMVVHWWGREEKQVRSLQKKRENQAYLPGIAIPDSITISSDLKTAVLASDLVFFAVPSAAISPLLATIAPWLTGRLVGIAWGAKGLDPATGRWLHQVIADAVGPDCPAGVLSGPSFAREVADGLPTAVVVAANQLAFAEQLQRAFHTPTFRVYTAMDVLGVELGGAVKNVIAIAAGLARGLGFGGNAQAALITRALSEIIRLGEALGAQRETLMGLSGVGDLILTCTDNQSRNRRFGEAIVQYGDVALALRQVATVIEGYRNTLEIWKFAHQFGVHMPIVQTVHCVLYEGVSPRDAADQLLNRPMV